MRGNDSEVDVTERLNTSVSLEKSFRSSVCSDRESSSSFATFKCQCIGDDKGRPAESGSTTTIAAKVNVRDLISRFENRNESIVLC